MEFASVDVGEPETRVGAQIERVCRNDHCVAVLIDDRLENLDPVTQCRDAVVEIPLTEE